VAFEESRGEADPQLRREAGRLDRRQQLLVALAEPPGLVLVDPDPHGFDADAA
jgi:hypothetical protein